MARLILVAPGRGSYNSSELGYLLRFPEFAAARRDIYEQADRLRISKGRESISALDSAANYALSKHLPGENASGLIFTCAAADFVMLKDNHQINAVLGNSMGWYTTLYTSGALDFKAAFELVDAMGWQQKGHIIGGQIIYPLIDASWREVPGRETQVMAVLDEVVSKGHDFWVGLSIRLGGLLVLAGTDLGIKTLLETLPPVKLGRNDYPFQLARHSAFHTPLMREASQKGLSELINIEWDQPQVPMIDGCGRIWRRYQTPARALRNYTLVDQVMQAYDFTSALKVGLREYNPDHVVLLGPGESMGGAIAQTMIAEGWRGLHHRDDFIAAQKSNHPPLIAMNRANQAYRLLPVK